MCHTFHILECNSSPLIKRVLCLLKTPFMAGYPIESHNHTFSYSIMVMGDQNTHVEPIIMGALSTLSSSQLSSLCASLSSTFHHHRHRLISLLSSPSLFAIALNHLYSLPLPQKSLLVARHLLSFLHLLAPFFPSLSPPSPFPSHRVSLRDLDSVLLLLFFCEVHQHDPAALDMPPADWQGMLVDCCSDTMLKFSSGFTLSSPAELLGAFVDTLISCIRFVGANGCGGEAGREVAAAAAAVVALPSVDVKSGCGAECVICREEMREGRDVCELPCHHLFHWMCVLPWLRKKNTCPCCRFRLPTDDVYGEIQRLWEVIVKVGSQRFDQDQRP